MKLNPIVKIITVLSAAALLTGTVGVSASAVVIDEEETVAAPAETVSSGDLPSYYSSLDEGYVTRAKSQNYNDCWAYACLSVLESKLLKTGIATDASSVDFSELHMNLWAITRSDGTGWIRGKEDAGYCTIAPGYLSSWQGAVLESDAGDLSPDNKISGDQVSTDRAKYGVTGIRYVSRDNMDEVKRAIMDNGSVTAGYAKNNTYLNNGISYYMPPSYSGTNYGHVVAVVGWDDNYDKSNFRNTPNNNGAWLMNAYGNGVEPTGEEERAMFIDKSDDYLKGQYLDINIGDIDNKWRIMSAGTYTITVNQLEETVSIVKN